ncbi:MAG: hypothetical protein HQL97_13960, partial [Magnetococcales bacterium]|nr:hypothetical protein [Magnetococcales bacterium]
MKTGLRILGIALLGVILTGCGGGGSGSGSKSSSASATTTTTTSTSTTYYGIFQGSTVVGVHYKSELGTLVKEGETDSLGRFEYLSNGTTIAPVTFSVGGVVLGTITPSTTTGSYSMSVFDLVNASDVEARVKATNLQRFLASVDASPNADIIWISPATRTALASESVKLNELTSTDFDTRATSLINTLVTSGAVSTGTTLVSESAVTTHIQETKTQIDAARIGSVTLTTGAESVPADGKTRLLVQVKAKTSDSKVLTGGLVTVTTTLGSLGGETDLCATSTPTPTTQVERMTDNSGTVTLLLTPGCQSGTGTVTASIGGMLASTTVRFTASPISNTTSNTGAFQGYILEGVHYRSELDGEVREGETDSEGKFQYLSEGATIAPVTFSIGGMTLGTIRPTSTIGIHYVTVHDLVNPDDVDALTKATNLQRLLSSISTAATSNTIRITTQERIALVGESDQLAELPVSQFDARATTLINKLIAANALPAGGTLLDPSAVNGNLSLYKGQNDAARIDSMLISGSDTVAADGTTKITLQIQVVPKSGQTSAGTLVHVETSGGTLGNETNLCAATPVMTRTKDTFTRPDGYAYVTLTPGCLAGNVVVTASVGGLIKQKNIVFAPGPVVVSNSALVANPLSMTADGKTTAQVTVTLRDAHGNPASDNTTVTLVTDLGTISGDASQKSLAGKATFTLVAPGSVGTAHLSIQEYPALTASVTYAAVPDSSTHRTGVFQGYTLVGVHYKSQLGSSVLEGETDSEGKFQYLVDGITVAPVTFSIGGVVLGTINPPQYSGYYYVTVHDLVHAEDVDALTKAINIQRFLSSISTSATLNTILIKASERTALANESVNLAALPISQFETRAKDLVDILVGANILYAGTTLIESTAVIQTLRTTKSQIDGTRAFDLEINAGNAWMPADGQTQRIIQVHLKSQPNSSSAGALVHFETTGGTFGSETNLCTGSATRTSTADRFVRVDEYAYVTLTSDCLAGDVVVTAMASGLIVQKVIRFLPGALSHANSSLVANPTTLPGDGKTTTLVTATLRDAYGNALSDDTTVTLVTDLGTISGGASQKSLAGKATFTLVAPASVGTAHLSIQEYPALTASVTFSQASDTATHRTGVFQGYTLVGVHYKSQIGSSVLEGETDSEGKFQYLVDGTTVAP